MIINLPNLISILRILLVPPFIIMLINGQYKQGLIIFIIAALSDGLDGMIARLFNQKTEFGAQIDPLADKILLVSSYVILGYKMFIPVWLVVIIVSRDLLILLGIGIVSLTGFNVKIKPSATSKLTTFLQLFTAGMILLTSIVQIPYFILTGLFYITGAFTIGSGLLYIYEGMILLNSPR